MPRRRARTLLLLTAWVGRRRHHQGAVLGCRQRRAGEAPAAHERDPGDRDSQQLPPRAFEGRAAAHVAIYGGAPIYDGFLAYSHALPDQLSRQGLRGLGLDLYPDPEGGLYANPLLRQRLAAGPLMDRDWYRPGAKVLHTHDLDYNSTCVRLVSCLRLVRRWSRANPITCRCWSCSS